MQQKHVLVVDDNKDLLFMISSMLKIKGYKISAIENTDNLELIVAEHAPDAIIMDMLLCGTDGREVCRQLKANPTTSATPVLMLSAHPQAEEECLKAGADRFIEKPFEMQHLLNTLAEVLHN